MNVADSEVVMAILQAEGFAHTTAIEQADLILLNTCSIREHAEERIWNRLKELRKYKKARPGTLIGLVGCMAERLKEELIERESAVDIIAGPDAYRDLPRLVQSALSGDKGVNVMLSAEETYAEISPVRLDANGVSAFISIMRGCNNMCAYCVVPHTRGRERSRPPQTILREVAEVLAAGYKEVTLLGQNVNSYRWEEVDFAALLAMVAQSDPRLRVRFATSHPKDLSDSVLETIAAHRNICRSIHLPAQSGSTRILQKMNRKYTREWYLERIAAIRRILPEASITTDLIAGFCSETPQDHEDTLSLMREVGYDFAFMFKYSERPDTAAQRTMQDDVPDKVKGERLTQIIDLQNVLSLESNRRDVGGQFEVLVEGASKRSASRLFGRTSSGKVVIFDKGPQTRPGVYVNVEITDCSSATLIGKLIS